MRKTVLMMLLALGTMSLFNACSKQKEDETSTTSSSSSTTDAGVVINGVKWATRNVDAPGTFATNTYDAGMFYQWNSKVGWPSTGAIGSITATDGSTTWNSKWKGGYTKPSSTDIWISGNDPCPEGWSVPTYDEIETLLDTAKVTNKWTTENNIHGRRFTDKATGKSIFLPSAGSRDGGSIYPEDYGTYGTYWCSTANYTYGEADNLTFSSTNPGDNNSATRAEAYPIRPVAK